MPETAGIVGLGNIGSAIAKRLLQWPGGLVVHDVRKDAMSALTSEGAKPAATLAELAQSASIISIVVLNDTQVRQVVNDLLPACRPGTILAIHSTIQVDTAPGLAGQAGEQGVHVLDAPVSGGAIGAAQGRLAAMVGGDRAAYERAKPVMKCWAELTVHLGPAGAGTRAKLARNLLTFVGYAAAAESQRLAEAAGVDLNKLAAVVRLSDSVTGGPSAVMVRGTTAPLPTDDGLRPIFSHSRDLGEKDLDLALDLARELGIDVPLAALTRESLAAALGVPHDPGSSADESVEP